MHRAFRLRHLLILAAVLAVGLLPVYAFRSLGTADNFALLASTVSTTAGAGNLVVVNGAAAGGLGPGFGAGNVGADTFTPNPPNIAADGTVGTAGATLAQVDTLLADLFAEGQALGTVLTDPAAGPTDLGGDTLGPGVYFIGEDATVPAGTTLTLSGPGDYLIVVDGSLSVGAASAINATDSAANVIFAINGATGNLDLGAGANVDGKFLVADLTTVAANVNLVGKLLGGTGSLVSFAGPAMINDAGATPTLTLSGVTGEPPAAGGDVDPTDEGTLVDPLVVTEGQTLSFTITGTDPDVSLTSAARTSVTPAGAAAFFTSPSFASGNPTATLNEVFTAPLDGLSGLVEVVYTVTDQAGAINQRSVFIFINQLPETSGPTNVAGAAPGSGSGAPGDPFVVCVGDTFTFDFTGSDPDADGGPTTLDVTGEDGVANLTFTPALPATEGDDDVTTSVAFTPDASQGGSTTSLTFTVTDDDGETASETVEIFVDSLPTFAAPFTEPGLDIITGCVGELLQFDISASDPDPGDSVSISVDGAPVGAAHDPNVFGVDNVGPFGDDVLIQSGFPVTPNDPVTTRFQWVPTPGDEGVYPLTYTAEDSFGCLTSTTVLVFITNEPTISATASATAPAPGSPSDFGTVTEAEVVDVCPGGTLTIPITAIDPDGDTVEISQAGAPGTAVFTPALPASGAGTSTSTLTFTPTPAQAGQTFTVALTATDTTNLPTITDPSIVQCDVTETLTFTIRVANVPTIAVTGLGDTAVGPGNIINGCAGVPVSFRVRSSDVDSDSVTLSASGAPVGGLFTPGLPAAGNPVESDFTFTPSAATPAVTVITLTATDSDGCATTSTVTINNSQNPVITVSGITGQTPLGAGTGTQADPLVVCAPGTAVANTLSFTVAAADPDAVDTVTLSQTGAPANATFTPTLPATGAPGATVSSVFSFTPTAAQAGQTFAVAFSAVDSSAAACSDSETVFIRVSAAPVVTTTAATINVCEGDDLTYRIRATDTDSNNVTIGVPVITSTVGAPALALTNTPTLPTTGNPVETVVTGTAPAVGAPAAAGAPSAVYTVTYTATDEDGCASTVAVTVNVFDVAPTTVTLIQSGSLAVGSQVCFVAEVRDNCPLSAGGPQLAAGVPVCFTVNGTTGNNQQVTLVTGADGRTPPFCFTPVFAGADTVTAVIDFNGDCIADLGTTGATTTVTIGLPATDAGCSVTGHGFVDASGLPFATRPIPGQFNLDVKVKRNGTPAGRISFVVPTVGRTGVFKANSTRIDSLTCFETATGRSAIIFGSARTSDFGTVPFRIDVADNGTPGVPNDKFVATLMLPDGTLVVSGGSLGFTRNSKGARVTDDIKIRLGSPRPGQR